jgi:hypothetical protein
LGCGWGRTLCRALLYWLESAAVPK